MYLLFLFNGIIALLISPHIVRAKYDGQPKILTQKGSLILEAANDHNITIRLSLGSSILVNDVDIMDKIRQRYPSDNLDGKDGGSKPFDIPTTQQVGDEIHKLQYDIARLSQRLYSLQNRTSSTQQLGAIRRYMGRMRRLNGLLTVLEQNIANDECAELRNPCKNGGICYDVYKGYHCECSEGWKVKYF